MGKGDRKKHRRKNKKQKMHKKAPNRKEQIVDSNQLKQGSKIKNSI